MEPTLDGAQAQPTRPTFLTVLCILTWIASGLGFLAYLLLVVAAGAMHDTLKSIPGIGDLVTAGIAYFAILMLAAGGKIFGAVQMWKLKGMGFYIYAACELIMFVVGYLAIKDIPNVGFPTMGLVFSLLFIGLYGMNLKHMKN